MKQAKIVTELQLEKTKENMKKMLGGSAEEMTKLISGEIKSVKQT